MSTHTTLMLGKNKCCGHRGVKHGVSRVQVHSQSSREYFTRGGPAVSEFVGWAHTLCQCVGVWEHVSVSMSVSVGVSAMAVSVSASVSVCVSTSMSVCQCRCQCVCVGETVVYTHLACDSVRTHKVLGDEGKWGKKSRDNQTWRRGRKEQRALLRLAECGSREVNHRKRDGGADLNVSPRSWRETHLKINSLCISSWQDCDSPAVKMSGEHRLRHPCLHNRHTMLTEHSWQPEQVSGYFVVFDIYLANCLCLLTA